jgi:protein-tyrosine phosphatase
VPPFTVLHVCMGNICRSPMAERLLHLALRARVGDRVDELFLSHGAGTGGWHVGEPMNPPAARQVVHRGGDSTGFKARKLDTAMIEASDLILCASSDQVDYVVRLRPDAASRTFVLGEFGRLLADLPLAELPAADHSVRGIALVAAADAARLDPAGRRAPAHRTDDLDDPWGKPDREFARVADEIERTVVPLAMALTS